MTITDRKQCSGCAVCVDVCPKNCITMEYDQFGFYYPNVNENICVRCKQCVLNCPQNKYAESSEIKKIYKGYIEDIESEENQKSTSGAIFPLLAKNVIDDCGVVVGVAFDKDYKNISHVICEDMDTVSLCRGSKYIQSQTQGIYRKVKEILKTERKVLFTGTPCQVWALKTYLKEIPDNLIVVDFVCHGVGSTVFFQEYVKSKTDGAEIKHIGFRDKCGCYTESAFRIVEVNGKEIIELCAKESMFFKAFANNLISRPSCGICRFASPERISDITVADNFIYATTEKEKMFGSSLIFVNTDKGAKLLECVKQNVVLEELPSEKVIPDILHFNHPAIPHKDRELLLNSMAKYGYAKCVRYISEYQPKISTRKRIARKIKKIIKRIKAIIK